jgi:hypothetical protein
MAPRACALPLLAALLLLLLLAGGGAAAAKGGKAHKRCAKAFPGCVACSGEGDAYTCDACIANAAFDPDAGRCICNSDPDGYGTITKRQLKAYRRANKGGGKQLSRCLVLLFLLVLVVVVVVVVVAFSLVFFLFRVPPRRRLLSLRPERARSLTPDPPPPLPPAKTNKLTNKRQLRQVCRLRPVRRL